MPGNSMGILTKPNSDQIQIRFLGNSGQKQFNNYRWSRKTAINKDISDKSKLKSDNFDKNIQQEKYKVHL
jgi:hypothetical protein